MPSWNELLDEFDAFGDKKRFEWHKGALLKSLGQIGTLRGVNNGARNVIVYASAFLQKPMVPSEAKMISHEDINGFMSVVYGMDASKGLTLILHTPGGSPTAAEQIVAYLRSKFDDIEVIVPAIAMSAGTMMALSSSRIVMGRQSQLGPIDPQMVQGGGRSFSARGVVEQFKAAREDVLATPGALNAWAPILQSMGPALVQDAQNALDYSERTVAKWLLSGMLDGDTDADTKSATIAQHFNNADLHKSHGRRIDRDEARSVGVKVEDLEDSQELQEQVLTAYHLITIMFERTNVCKIMATSGDRTWVKQWNGIAQAEHRA